MRQEDIRYGSWVVSIISIIYGVASLLRLYVPSEGVTLRFEYNYYVYVTLFIMLIVFGITKTIGLFIGNRLLRKVSIVSLMFSWGFVWTSSIIHFIREGFNHQSILIMPIIALCVYIARRGDYS